MGHLDIKSEMKDDVKQEDLSPPNDAIKEEQDNIKQEYTDDNAEVFFKASEFRFDILTSLLMFLVVVGRGFFA